MKARLLAISLAATGLLHAQTIYSPATGWDFASNPSGNGPWSYGYKSTVTGSLTLFDLQDSSVDVTTLEYWHTSIATLGVGLNTSSTTNWGTGSTVANPLEFNLHPGASNEMAVLRFTAPTTGDFTFAGTLSGNSGAGTSTTGYLVHNTNTFLTQTVSGFNSTYGFSETRSLTSGDTVDLVVDWGSNGNYFNDSTGLYLTVTAIPEPAALPFVAGILGLTGLFLFRRKALSARSVG